MKVCELIAILQELDPDANIGVSYDGEEPYDLEFEWSERYQAYVDYEG